VASKNPSPHQARQFKAGKTTWRPWMIRLNLHRTTSATDSTTLSNRWLRAWNFTTVSHRYKSMADTRPKLTGKRNKRRRKPKKLLPLLIWWKNQRQDKAIRISTISIMIWTMVSLMMTTWGWDFKRRWAPTSLSATQILMKTPKLEMLEGEALVLVSLARCKDVRKIKRKVL
jgi:hypothetical protein